ncbi:MAG TPA: hypothetical protein VGJ05_02670, partial [Fimbriiglobus sp.]
PRATGKISIDPAAKFGVKTNFVSREFRLPGRNNEGDNFSRRYIFTEEMSNRIAGRTEHGRFSI